MSKILLIVPPIRLDINRDIGHAELFPHLGLCYVASFLRSKGHDVLVCDAPAEKISMSVIGRKIVSFNPNIVGITAKTLQIHEAHEVAKIAKNVNSEIITIIGGVHSTALPVETLDEFSFFDLSVAGEGEETMAEIAASFDNDGNLSKIKGTAYRDSGSVIMSQPREYISDLDSIPFPAFDQLPLDYYRPYYSPSKKIRTLPILSKRGCPQKCNFCFKVQGDKLRMRSIENVTVEIKRDIEVFNVGQIIFQDETFTIDKKWAVNICESILSNGLNKRTEYICETRVDAVDIELLKLMKKAGFAVINYGAESGSQTILDKNSKGINIDQIKQAIKLTKEAGIKVHTNFIVGQAFENEKTIAETVNLALEMDPDFVGFSILVPFPGTEVWKMAEDNIGGLKIISRDWRKYGTQIGGALELDSVPRWRLERLQATAYFKFYARPNKIMNIFKIVNIKAVPLYLMHLLKNML